MATFLINAPQEQKIATREHGLMKCLVYSNPAYYQPKVLARDFGRIGIGDRLILCRDSKLKVLAEVAQITFATDASEGGRYSGLPVKILQGKIVKRFTNISVGAASNRLRKNGVAVPNLINSKLTGFKQGAFAEALTEDQVTGYEVWVAAS